MLKKKKLQLKQKILKYYFVENELIKLVHRSLYKNFEVEPTSRYSQQSSLNMFIKYYSRTRERLYCAISSKPRVPCYKYKLSRYYWSSRGDNLKITRISKI